MSFKNCIFLAPCDFLFIPIILVLFLCTLITLPLSLVPVKFIAISTSAQFSNERYAHPFGCFVKGSLTMVMREIVPQSSKMICSYSRVVLQSTFQTKIDLASSRFLCQNFYASYYTFYSDCIESFREGSTEGYCSRGFGLLPYYCMLYISYYKYDLIVMLRREYNHTYAKKGISIHHYLWNCISLMQNQLIICFVMNEMIKATKEHCRFCFEILIAKLIQLPTPSFPKHLPNITVPLFVTWSYGKNSKLRGCIGTFEPRPIQISLPQFAKTSAFKDPRFRPISIDEVQKLKVEVSLLTNFKQKQNLYEWQIGRHGIILSFRKGFHTYNGTFLPEIAKEQGWNHEETLNHLVKKTGYKGSTEIIEGMELTTYESSKACLTYDEYKAIIQNQIE